MTTPTRDSRDRWVTHGVDRPSSVSVRRANLDAATALTETLRTTLGPMGMDKMLVGRDGRVVVTNDGASVLREMELDDPAARLLATAATAQEETVRDGTTAAVVLAGSLLGEARSLLDEGLHPTTVVSGFERAAALARGDLDDCGVSVDATDDTVLRDVARTTVTGRWDDPFLGLFADLAVSGVRAVETDGTVSVRDLTLATYPGGEVRDSTLLPGLLVDTDASSTSMEALDSHLPRTVVDARIALLDDELTVENGAVGHTTVSTADELRRLQRSESDARSMAVQRLAEHDVDVLFCQKSVDDEVRTALARRGTLVFERTRQDELDALARATGATALVSLTDLDAGAVGHAGTVERRDVGTTPVVVVTDGPGTPQASLLVRGGTAHVAEETRRVLEDCIATVELTVRDGVVLPGGGAAETALAGYLRASATEIDDREQLAVEAFAAALDDIPRTLARNAGRSPIDLLAALRVRHRDGAHTVGVDASGECRDMVSAGVLLPRAVVDRYLAHATAAATTVLRIDDVIAVSGSENASTDHADHDHADDTGYPWAIGH